MDRTIFVTKASSTAEKAMARLLIHSIRAFTGAMADCPIWVFALNPEAVPCQDLADEHTRVIPLVVPDPYRGYLFGDKVYACARAEELAPTGTQDLVWVDATCLIVQPPVLYRLGEEADAAFRPVHIRNVGMPVTSPLDAYWQRIYQAVGAAETRMSVETFVDRQRIRAYLNTHAFAINPALGLLSRWTTYFEALVCDQAFQSVACQDELHQIFLHQAVLSALIDAALPANRLRILPPDYNYPYNLHASLPLDRRVKAMNDLVSFTYEDRTLNPAAIDDIEVREPLHSWLAGYC